MSYDFEFFTSAVKALETPKRFKHTLGVQREAYELGMIYLPEKAEKLAFAGLLHVTFAPRYLRISVVITTSERFGQL